MKTRFIASLGFFLLLSNSLSAEPDARPYNVLFIISDDLTATALGCYGNDGYHLGEHDLWSKVSIHEESALVPLIISVPGKEPAVCHSFAELLDLYPTVSKLCGLEIPGILQGRDISAMLDNPGVEVRDAILSSGKGRLYRTEKWAFLDYGKSGELYDMEEDPKQYTNLIDNPEYADVLADLKEKMAAKLHQIQNNDLGTKQ